MNETETLIARITEYLSAGGLLNPELMDHAKVSQLLYDCRKALGQHFSLENFLIVNK